jgi:hypothetical protein
LEKEADMLTISLLLVVLAAAPADESDSRREVKDFLARADQQPLVYDNAVVSRIERNADGAIIRLRMDEFQFVEADWLAIKQIDTLQSIQLRKSNVRNDDLVHLKALPNLRGMVLNSTNVTDDAIGHIAAIPDLRSVCLGDVLITPEGLANLKLMRPKLGIGYSSRK